jgi:prepilin-type N-terminal cleavage/methylation domain-containing protein
MMNRGVSLAEMIVVIALTGVVSAALLSTIRNFYISNAYVFEAAVSVDSARRGLATTLSALREASYGDDGNYPIALAATSSVTFYSDIDSDGGIERVKVYILDATLYRVITNASGNPPVYTNAGSATTTVATYVRNGTSTPLFKYYDSNGTELSATSTNESDIASVSSTLMVDLNPNRAPNVLTMTGSATLRNLLDR